MNLFDELIQKTRALLPEDARHCLPIVQLCTHSGTRSQLILGKETAFELGGGNFPSASCTMYTEDQALVPKDAIMIYGTDLPQISCDCAFARLAFIRTDFIEAQGDQGAYGILENIGLKKYDVFPKGYMVRTSALSNREQVRVSKDAVKNGLSFSHVGSMYISEYHKNPHVKAVQIVFVTLPEVDYKALDHLGTLSNQVFRALNRVLADLKMDCKGCQWKLVCDEVEGIKLLHQEQLQKNL